MSIPFNRRLMRGAAAALMLAVLSPVAASARSGTQSGTKSGTVTGSTRSHKSPKGNANQPAPTEHQVQPSQKLQDEPNQVKEQVAPTPAAPVKPGTGVSAGQDTPTPHS